MRKDGAVGNRPWFGGLSWCIGILLAMLPAGCVTHSLESDRPMATWIEMDPTLVPPESSLYQPKRGFGKLWRNTPEIKDALGWATTPEFGLNTTYVYQAGGYLDSNNKFVPRPGKHFIMTLSRQTFALSEPEPPNVRGKWERVS